MTVRLRAVTPGDNGSLARIICATLMEFGADGPGFAWADPQLDQLFEAYQGQGHRYLVAVDELGHCLGGGGIAPFRCERASTCELQKMYLLPEARGRGIGRVLLQRLLGDARRLGFEHCYLETFGPMLAARGLYLSMGFEPLAAPWGNSGHHACDTWMVKTLVSA